MAKRPRADPTPDPEPTPETVQPAPPKPATPRRRQVASDASAAAPFIYFENAPNYGVNNGVVNVTLETLRYIADGADIHTDRVIVAHLRMSIASAKALKLVLEKALLLATPVPSNQRN